MECYVLHVICFHSFIHVFGVHSLISFFFFIAAALYRDQERPAQEHAMKSRDHLYNDVLAEGDLILQVRKDTFHTALESRSTNA